MQKKCERNRWEVFYYRRSPTAEDCINYMVGDMWFDFLTSRIYILKCRKGNKKWCIYDNL